MDLTHEVLRSLEQTAVVWAYGLIVFAACVEYIFPPFPGDTVVLSAVVLAARAQLQWPWVLLAATLGAVLGGAGAWWFGRWLAEQRSTWPRFLRNDMARQRLDAVRQSYGKYGAAYLMINRFLPALRAFFFVGAGLSRLPLRSVIFFGGLSALIWNALLVAAGYALSDNWPLLHRLLQQYGIGVFVIVTVAALTWWIRSRSR